MKQRWINTRMKMLHELLPSQKKDQTKEFMHEFLQKLQPEYPKKISVTYQRHQGEDQAIPLQPDLSKMSIPLEPKNGNPIPLQPQSIPLEEKKDDDNQENN
uniref:Uncharacterized protein n=1 Tax=Strombidinopsis acuminata TaxID=141414 RepID=A0A7S3SS95_9SPIT|mmetsp:Transcript_42514/g.57798  ORF Transcript_42514/g.57798 Transcript_42514/m.57798 type:complete len:101 (+) Transcript_42514:2-304(+)